jgi:hypothetical protein
MTNKEKLEIIDKKLDELYWALNTEITKDLLLSDYRNLTQSIYNLESTKLLLEPIENNLEIEKIYILEINNEDDGEELNTFVFDNLEDFNKAKNLINHWGTKIRGLSISEMFEINNIKFIDCIYNSISI